MLTSKEIADRIKSVCYEKRITPTVMLRNAGISTSTLSNFDSSMPKCDTLARIADELNISLDYLCGRTDQQSGIYADQPQPSSVDLSEDEQALLASYRSLDWSSRAIVHAAAVQEQRRAEQNGGTAQTVDPAHRVG